MIPKVDGIKDIFKLSRFIDPSKYIKPKENSSYVNLKDLENKDILLTSISKRCKSKYGNYYYYICRGEIPNENNRKIRFSSGIVSIVSLLDDLKDALDNQGYGDDIPKIKCKVTKINGRFVLVDSSESEQVDTVDIDI